MISTFDLSLMGGLISLGGLVFFLVANRRRTATRPETCATEMPHLDELHERRHRAERMAGTRWLTVGVLVLFVGFTRGTTSGYLFDLWTDIVFHVGILSACWAATAYRVKQIMHRPTQATAASVATGHAPDGLKAAG